MRRLEGPEKVLASLIGRGGVAVCACVGKTRLGLRVDTFGCRTAHCNLTGWLFLALLSGWLTDTHLLAALVSCSFLPHLAIRRHILLYSHLHALLNRHITSVVVLSSKRGVGLRRTGGDSHSATHRLQSPLQSTDPADGGLAESTRIFGYPTQQRNTLPSPSSL